jgi:predicted DNA-binding transcriptional regulator AlpA
MTAAQITSCAAPRRGLSRVESALYFGISPSKFDELRKDGRVPPPRLIDGRKVWDVKELDIAFEEFPLESNDNSEDWTASV